MSGITRPRTWLGRTTAVVVVAVLVGSWFCMMRAARRAMSFEPTTDALARSAAARPEGIRSALVVMVAAAVLAPAARRFWLVLLAAPGLVTAAALALAPGAAAYLLGLVATAVTLPVVLAAVGYARDPLFRPRTDGSGPS